MAFVLKLVWAIMSPIVTAVNFLLQPVYLFVGFFLSCLALPIRLLLALETVYIYLGVASLTGLLVGALLCLCYSSVSAGMPVPERRIARRPVKPIEPPKLDLSLEGVTTPLADVFSGQCGQFDQTIYEEYDSDY